MSDFMKDFNHAEVTDTPGMKWQSLSNFNRLKKVTLYFKSASRKKRNTLNRGSTFNWVNNELFIRPAPALIFTNAEKS